MQLLFSGCYASLALGGNIFNAFTIDYIGRVNALRIGWIGDAVALIGECIALSTFTRTNSHAAAVASVFFLFLHIALFAFNIDVTTYVYTSEIFPNHIRAKGMSTSIVAYFASLIIYLEVAPTAFAAIGWKFYLVFLIALFFFILPLFFYFPESKGLSLEEVARLFDDEVTTVRLDAGAAELPKDGVKAATRMSLAET
jgi:MFS family permease